MSELEQAAVFFLVFVRALAFLMSGPLYAIKGIPPLVKIGFSLALGVLVFPVLGPVQSLPVNAWGYALAIVAETGAGLLLGTAVTMIMNSFRMAGHFIDFQIGYAMTSLVDPMYGIRGTLLSQYLYLLGMLFFLVIDGHYTLITGLVASYQLVPLGEATFNGGMALALLQVFSMAFTIALKIAVPVLAVLVISDLTLGFLARTTPQINVFLTGFPIKIGVGLLTLSIMLPLLGNVLRTLLNMIEKDLYMLMRVMV